jgi:hypothetical protein
MARIRTVKPDYWGDPKTARLSLPARLLFIGLLTEADDEGRFLASGKKLAGSLFPNDEDVTPKKVTGWLVELEQVGFVRRYTSDGVEYAHIPAFNAHQRISHPTPSRLPNPEDCPNLSGNDPELFAPDLGTGNTEQGRGSALCATRVPIPFEVDDSMVEWAQREMPGFDWDAETKKFVDYWRAKSGRDATKLDWPATWRNWMRRSQEGAFR